MKSTTPRVQLDEIDIKILKRLQQDARVSNVELSDHVGLSPAPCLRRVRALEQSRVIRRYVTLIDPAAVDLNVTVFIQITLDLQVEGRLEIFEQAIVRRPEVLECYLMTGDADYLLRVVVPDVSAYERFLRDALTRIESAAGIKSSFALKQVKYSTALPLSDAPAGFERHPIDPPVAEGKRTVRPPHTSGGAAIPKKGRSRRERRSPSRSD